MKRSMLLAVLLACAWSRAEASGPHAFPEVAISPDGRHVASVEGDLAPGEWSPSVVSLVIRDRAGAAAAVELPCGKVAECTPSDLAWTADSRHLAFALRSPGSHARAIYQVDAAAGAPLRLAAFDGTITGLRFGPGGALAVLATSGADKEVGATEAGAAVVGELGAAVHEQRIAVLDGGSLRFVSPPDKFVYEYDWLPDGSGFVGTAAPGDGDSHWWVAKLYAFSVKDGAARVLYAPPNAQQQIAQPRVSPDGLHVSFIAGLMSDFGSTGGDAFVLDIAGGAPRNLTEGARRTVVTLGWACTGGGLSAVINSAGRTQFVSLGLQGEASAPVDTGEEKLSAGDTRVSVACGSGEIAAARQTFVAPEEIVVGRIGGAVPLTHENAGLDAPYDVRRITWNRAGFDVQGWVILPRDIVANAKLPMVTIVHGGPAAAHEPKFLQPEWQRPLLERGYAVFLPNPRGSYGQGEAFTAANVRDFGHGDLDDILTGIDAAARVAPIDPERQGIMGWSYGGFMTMFAVTQTDRFRAAFAGAGIANWQSYYGESGIDAWMVPYFGASVYDDPDVYARSSPMSFVKRVRTPTFAVVGERDIECPAPQTVEFRHALDALGVPTGAVIYEGEGHHIRTPEHAADIERRMVGWFDTYLEGP